MRVVAVALIFMCGGVCSGAAVATQAAGSLVSVSSAVQRSVVGRLQLHELQAVLSKLSHAQQALVFMAMAPDRQASLRTRPPGRTLC